MSEDEATDTAVAEGPSLEPSQIQYLEQRLASEQNMVLAIVAGAVASLVGAVAWAGITVVTGYQIGFMSIGIGFLVGFAVRTLGKGISSPFGVVGAIFSLVGCGLGNLLAVLAMVAENEGIEFFSALSQLNFPMMQELMVATFTPMDLLFYAIAIYYGFKLAFRQLDDAELGQMLTGGGNT